jgi:hypothetical protein
MANYNINAVTRRVVYTGSAGLGPYAFSFEILVETDVDVYFNTTLLTLTTDYTVTINANGTGSVTIVTGTSVPTTPDADDQITIVGARDIERTTDFVTAGDFRASAINEQLDALTIFDQQLAESADRAIKAPVTDPTSINMTLPAKAARANAFLLFDADGDPSVQAAGTPGTPTSITRQQFSGDGSTVVFTLASDPQALGNSLSIYISGVYQQRATYTVSGTALTFSAAPPVGTNNIEVVNYTVTDIGSTDASLVTYTPAGTGAVERTVQSVLREGVSVKDFGAVGDGVTDDTVAVQAAVNVGRVLQFPPGTYKFTSSVQVPQNTIVDLGSAVIDMSSAPSGSNAFRVLGTFDSAYSLTADTSINGTTLTLSSLDAANFAEGDYVQVYSNTVYDTGWSNATIGEIVRVYSVSGTTVTLNEPLVGGPYTLLANASVRKANMVGNVEVRNGTIIGSTNPATIHTGVRFEIAKECKVFGTRILRCNGNGVNFRNAIYCIADSIYVEGDPDTTVNSYSGVNATDTSQDCKVVNSTFVSVHHGFTTTTSTGQGLSRRIVVDNCTAISSNDNGDQFDTHGGSEDIWFVNCTALGSSANGFNLECGSGGVVNCKAIRPTLNGINLTLGSTIKPSDFYVANCRVVNAPVYGIRANQGSAINSSTIERVSIYNSSATGCQIGAYVSGNSSLLVQNAEIVGGYYTATSTAGAVYIGDYVTNFSVTSAHASTGLVNGSAIQLVGSNVSYGRITSCVAEYSVNGANGVSSSACIRLTNVNNISLSNNIGRQPASSGGWGIRTTGTTSNIIVGNTNNFLDCGNPGTYKSQNLTIASGGITLPHGGDMFVYVDTEGGAATDDLDTINNGVAGQVITLQQVASARDIVVKDTTGNIRSAGDFTMNNVQDSITLKYNGSAWVEIGRADIA